MLAQMTQADRTKLIDKVMGENQMDNLQLMVKMKDRLDRVELEYNAVEVRWQNLTVETEVHVGNRALPTLGNALIGMFEDCIPGSGGNKKRKVLLDNVSGVLPPGTMTLVLGPPGAGKSTLLKALSGQIKDHKLKVSGQVLYNGKSFDEFTVERTAAYVDQVDHHIPEMTVRETLRFAARCMGLSQATGLYNRVVAKEKELGIKPDPELDKLWRSIIASDEDNIMVQIVLRLLGLEGCADTVVGGDMLKGISGGQKKRVTTAELMVGQLPCLFLDEISTGLDSSSTFLITTALRNLSHYLNTTMAVALLQPAPETYDLFDAVLLVTDTKIVYFGPREDIIPFFESMHFKCPELKPHADYLQEVTSKVDQPFYWDPAGGEYDYVSAADMAAKFEISENGKALSEELAEEPFTTPYDDEVLVKKEYAVSSWRLFLACLEREILLTRRNKMNSLANLTNILITGFMVATTFTKLPKDETNYANLFLSVIYYSAETAFFVGFIEVPLTISYFSVAFKQRDNKFFPAWAYAIAGWVMRIPENIMIATAWTVIVYWSVGFVVDAGRFFIFWFAMIVTCIYSTAMFRFIAALTRDEVLAEALGAVVLLLTITTCGYPISRKSIPPWWIWMYWLSPLAWVVRALSVNELTSSDWNMPYVVGVDSNGKDLTEPLGIFVLEYRGYLTDWQWVWSGIGTVAGIAMILAVGYATCLTLLDAPKEAGANATEDDGASKDKVKEQEEEMEKEETAHRIFSVMPPGSVIANKFVQDVEAQARRDSEARAAKSKNTLTFDPMTVTFKDVKYHVPSPKGEGQLTLLQGVSGCFCPGILTALMGASGAGKTTLMDVLAGRKTGGSAEGDQLVNGHPKDMVTFARVIGYVEQFDIHSSQATVYEALLFSARMRLNGHLAYDVIKGFVEDIMELVELGPLRDALVGLPGQSGLSVEQRKRLTIAVELVANPSIVFMDEPTSGLDARASAIVMRTVRNTVSTGRTVVCTIHQPSLEIFQAFDELLLLKPGGYTIYFGPMGPQARTLIDHFESVEGIAKFERGMNPANWMLDVTAPAAEKALGIAFEEHYSSSALAKEQNERIADLSKPREGTSAISFVTRYSRNILTQFWLCLEKNNTLYYRSPNYNMVRFLITIVVGLLFGTLYWNQGNDRDSLLGVLNILGGIYSTVMFMGVLNALIVMSVVANERTVFYRERAMGYYHPLAYSLAQGAIEIPYVALQSILYTVIVYFMIHFEFTASKFFWFLLFFFLNLWFFTAFGIMCINLTPTVQLGSVLASFFVSLWNLYCGFLISGADIKDWWIWAYYFNPVTYVMYGCIVTQLGDVETRISDDFPQQRTVKQYLEDQYWYYYDMRGPLVGILLGFITFVRLLSALSLYSLNWSKR